MLAPSINHPLPPSCLSTSTTRAHPGSSSERVTHFADNNTECRVPRCCPSRGRHGEVVVKKNRRSRRWRSKTAPDPWISSGIDCHDTFLLFLYVQRHNGVDPPGRRTFVDYAVRNYDGPDPTPTREQWEAVVQLMRDALNKMVVVSSEGSGSSGAMNVVSSPDKGTTTGSEGSDPTAPAPTAPAPGISGPDLDGHDDESELRDSRSGDSDTPMDEEALIEKDE